MAQIWAPLGKNDCYTNACIENNSITFYNIKESRSAYISFFFCWTNASLSLPHTKRIASVSSYILSPDSLSVLSQFYMKDCQMWKHCSLIASAMQASGLHLPPCQACICPSLNMAAVSPNRLLLTLFSFGKAKGKAGQAKCRFSWNCFLLSISFNKLSRKPGWGACSELWTITASKSKNLNEKKSNLKVWTSDISQTEPLSVENGVLTLKRTRL